MTACDWECPLPLLLLFRLVGVVGEGRGVTMAVAGRPCPCKPSKWPGFVLEPGEGGTMVTSATTAELPLPAVALAVAIGDGLMSLAKEKEGCWLNS